MREIKISIERAVNRLLFIKEHELQPDYCNGNLLRVPTICDVKLRYARWYVKAPENCGYDDGKGCYSYCNAGQKGSFPVWVVRRKEDEEYAMELTCEIEPDEDIVIKVNKCWGCDV